jgi:hypothetical protein
LLKEAAKEGAAEVIQKLSGPIHRAMVENKLLKHQNEGLLASLDIQNKRTRNGRRLPLKGKQKKPTDATIFTPCEVQASREVRRRKDEDKLAELQRKLDTKEANKQKKEVKERRAAEARAERDRKQKVKEEEKAEKAAQKQAEKRKKDTEKALLTSQKGKRKASKPLPKQPKRQKKVGSAVGGAVGSSIAHGATSALPTKQSRGGRKIITPAKFR